MIRLATCAFVLVFVAPPLHAQRTREEGPAVQARVLGIIADFADRNRAAYDAATRMDLVTGRWEALCPALPRGAFRGWRGVVEERSYGPSITLTIRFDERVMVTNALPPGDGNAQRVALSPNSRLHRVADDLRRGAQVEIDFIPAAPLSQGRSGGNCLSASNASQTGLMETPTFFVEFADIRPVTTQTRR